jgi:uncharacterized ion transporter superfamily protein YfcC
MSDKQSGKLTTKEKLVITLFLVMLTILSYGLLIYGLIH